MREITFSLAVIYFFVYSVAGWLCETVWCSAAAKKPVNRGFLSGPYCPLYGFGALMILLWVYPLRENPVLVFLAAAVMASALEYFTGWLLEVMFQARWWDYSKKKLQLHGRICLRNSILFGLLGVLVIYGIHPVFEQAALLIEPSLQRVLSSVALALMVMDLLKTLAALAGLQERTEAMKAVLEELERYQQDHRWYEKKDRQGNLKRLKELCLEHGGEQAAEILAHIEKIETRQGSGFRVLEAFPDMRSKELPAEMEELREHWKAQRQARKRDRKEKLRCAVAPVREAAAEAFSGFTLMHLFWIFLAGSVIGYLVETGYCFLAKGVIESRQGMLYGPFSQLYGFAALVGTFLLVPLAAKGNLCLFLGSAVVGGAFEVISSLFQEAAFGSISWQYSSQPLSFFGGRTSLMFMFFWGVLGSFYVRMIYPRLIKVIKGIHQRSGRFLAGTVVVVISLNLALSVAALDRWGDRLQGEAPANSFQQFLDDNYPDEKMGEIYPSMKFFLEEMEDAGGV